MTPPPPFAVSETVPAAHLAASSAAIRRYCGWHIAPRLVQEFVVDEPGGPDIFLPTLRINDVVGVMVDGVALTDTELIELEWSSKGYVGRAGWWPVRRRGVRITVDHGWDFADVPDVVALSVDLAGRVAAAPAGVVRSQVGQRLEEYTKSMLGDDRSVLDLYRIVGR